jgi:phospholipid-transporting ATPase
VITGESLLKISQNDKMLKAFQAVINCLPVVIACRITPSQKAEIVSLVRTADPQAVTLAIGDGANDVNMINAAHVGVGIRGLEGQQAARASDYALTQFHHLQNLLFVHGRECTRKNALAICYSFYKNAVLVAPNLL